MLTHSHSHPKSKVMTTTLQFHLLSSPPTRFLTQTCQVTALPPVHTYKGGSLNTTIPKLVGHLGTRVYTSLSLKLSPSHNPL